MNKGFQSYFFPVLLAAVLGLMVTGCNSDDTWGTEPADYSGTAVTGFALQKDNSVLNNLDSVYFSIDLIGCRIFNASPLPYGTKTDALSVSIACDACSAAQLIVNGEEEDNVVVVDYLITPDAKINFSNGPVKLHLVSADGLNERYYDITVNVATEKSDSLYWDELQKGTLHGVASAIRTKTVKINDKALMLSVSASGNVGISTFIPAVLSGGGNWDPNVTTPRFTNNSASVTPGSTLKVETFTATDNGDLFVTDINGNLYKSTDEGANFALVDTGWETITAPYTNFILGIKKDNSVFTHCAFPSSAWGGDGQTIPSGFPVEGMSAAAVFTTKWASSPQIVITGGKKANGTYTGATWAFDGSKWAKVSDRLPAASGYAMSRYTIAETDTTTWRVKQREVLITFGGMGIDEEHEVWISKDMGVNWQKGSQLLQLPEYMPFATGASMLVFDKTLDADSATPLAVKPITSWECPYLYLFGGYDAHGNLCNTYWSGVVNHLKVKPLQ